MTAGEYARLAELFDQAVAMDTAGRESLLAANPDLADRLRALLAADEAAPGATLLDRAAGEITTEFLASLQPAACGPYTLEEVIGEGGTGVVYRGRRADLNAVAAIKVLRDAWVSPARRQRFAREQRTLASLGHPGIAKLLDAGVTPDGTPWIAMELVNGVPLTRFAEDRALPMEARLRLFQAVCAAVQYAHERAVIHRDLKPSNILVEPGGAPRLLDFGIARHLDDDSTALTRPELRMMTPAYAAPEQMRGEPAGVYTDIYALGVILRELTANAPGELRAISERAADPDPARRYRSADALSRDIGRYMAREPLEARPHTAAYKLRKFLARHRGPLLAVSAGVLLLAATAGYFTWRLRQSRDEALAAAERSQRLQAFLMNLFEGGDRAAGPARGLTVEALIDRGVREAGALDSQPAAQGEVYETLGRMYGKLGRYQAAERLLKLASGRNSGGAHGVSSLTELALTYAEQNRFDEAEQTARRALEDGERTLGASHDLTLSAREMLGRIQSEHGKYPEAIAALEPALAARQANGDAAARASAASALSTAHFYAGHYDQARQLALRALDARRLAHGVRHALVAEDHVSLGAVEFDTGRYAEAEQHYRQALAIRQAWYGAAHPDTASAQTMLGRALVYQKKNDEAREYLEQALETQMRVFGPVNVRVASPLNDLGNIHVAEKRYAEAEKCYRQMEEIYRAAHGDGHYLVATAIANRGNVYLRQGDARKAEPLVRDAVRRYSAALSPGHANTAIARIRLGRVLLRQKRWRESAAESRAGYELLARQAKAPVSWLQGAREDLAAAYRELGDAGQAKRFRDELAVTGAK